MSEWTRSWTLSPSLVRPTLPLCVILLMAVTVTSTSKIHHRLCIVVFFWDPFFFCCVQLATFNLFIFAMFLRRKNIFDHLERICLHQALSTILSFFLLFFCNGFFISSFKSKIKIKIMQSIKTRLFPCEFTFNLSNLFACVYFKKLIFDTQKNRS